MEMATKRGASPSRNAAAVVPGAGTSQQVPFVDSPFLYYPKLAAEFPPEAAPKLIEAGLAARNEFDDLTEVRLPVMDCDAAKELMAAPLSRHLASVNAALGKEFEQVPCSARLLHIAIAKNQKALVTRFIASHGDLSLRTSPISCMNDLAHRGVQGLHDASITPVVVALWMKRHEMLQEMFENNVDPIFGGVVQFPHGDKLKSFMREHTDIDRCDFPPTPVGRRRSVLTYALKVADLKGMELFLKYAKAYGYLLKITPAEVEEAKKVRRDPAIAAKVEEAAKQGFVKICEDADRDLHPVNGEEDIDSPLRKQLKTSLVMGKLALLGIIIVLLVWIGIIIKQGHEKLEERFLAGVPASTGLDRVYRSHIRQYVHNDGNNQ